MKSKVFLIVLLSVFALLAGCNVESRLDCLNNTRQGITAINAATAYIKTSSANAETKIVLSGFIAVFDECNRRWCNYVLGISETPPDITCAADALINIFFTIETEPPRAITDEDVTDEMIINARALLDIAIENYHEAMIQYGMKED